ncbi:MAG: tetratricopeptide repeat protein, partial [Nitrospinaceae bacterium]|nr:tetratricopeptide repeat protein [Nitrospinaceae bacterium]
MARFSKAAERRKRRRKEREANSPPAASPPVDSPSVSPQFDIPRMMQVAIGHHMAGRFQEAESIYHEALEQNPNQSDAIHLLGMIRLQTGNHEEAVAYISKAISLNDSQAVYHSNLGATLLAVEKNDEAIESFARAIALDSNNSDAHENLARVHRERGANSEAADSFQKLLALKPDHPSAHRELGHVLLALGDAAGAAEGFREAVRLNPADTDAGFNLGAILKDAGDLDGAEEALREALRLGPDDLRAQLFLGATLFERGAHDEAQGWFQKALEAKPDFAEALLGLGAVFWLKKEPEAAEDHLRRALGIKPDLQDAYFYLAAIYADNGKVEEESAIFQEALARWPDNESLRLLVDIYFPPICMSSEEMDERRQAMSDALDLHDPAKLEIRPKDLPMWGRPLSFYMSYSGRDDLLLKSKYADLFARSFSEKLPHLYPPAGVMPPSGGGRPHIGFVATVTSSFLIWMKGVICHMTPGRFLVSIVCTPESYATISGHFKEVKELEYLIIDQNFEQAVNEIRAANFDLLFYHEVGSDPANYFLPFFRLAPVQCTSFYGLGNTSANPEVDYYLSSDLAEPEGGEAHYREELVRLKSLGFYLEWPEMPELMRERAHFGFAASEHVYACPQALYKIHPDLDATFGEILRRDPAGVIVLIESGRPEWDEALMSRLRAANPVEVDRVRMLPRQKKKDFLNLIAVSDVLLDSIHVSGGTTTFESLATGTPLVTCPGEFARGRFTYACYRKMGVLDCVAGSLEEYADIAVRLGG